MALATGRVSTRGGVDESPRVVPPYVSAPPCLVSSRDPTQSLGARPTYLQPEWVK